MDEVLRNAASLSWWLGVVLVGVVTSVVAAYLKHPLDCALARLSHAWATRTASRRLAFDEAVLRAAEEEFIRAFLRFRILRNWVVAITLTLVGVGSLVLAVGLIALGDRHGALYALSIGTVAWITGLIGFLLDTPYQVLIHAEARIGLTSAFTRRPQGRTDSGRG